MAQTVPQFDCASSDAAIGYGLFQMLHGSGKQSDLYLPFTQHGEPFPALDALHNAGEPARVSTDQPRTPCIPLPELSDQDIDDLLEWSQVDFTPSERLSESLLTLKYSLSDVNQAVSYKTDASGHVAERNASKSSDILPLVPSVANRSQASSSSTRSKYAPRSKVVGTWARHNLVEKRYRENLNNKFQDLARALGFNNGPIPSGHDLKAMNKGSILAGAISRIEELRAQNLSLKREVKKASMLRMLAAI